MSLLDDDGDLAAEDLGKVDLVSAMDDRSTADDERTIEVEGCPDAPSDTTTMKYAMEYKPRDGTAILDSDGEPTGMRWAVDGQPCLQTVVNSTDADNPVTTRTRRAVQEKMGRTATHPDGRADNYERVGYANELQANAATSITIPNSAVFDPTTALSTPTTVTDDPDAGRATNELTARANNRASISGAGDFYTCDEGDGGDDDADDNTSCDAEWTYDGELLFASGSFGCTTTRTVAVTCEWDASGEMKVGRNRAPDHFIAGGDDSNLANFIKCTGN